jgi:hypothetical protein
VREEVVQEFRDLLKQESQEAVKQAISKIYFVKKELLTEVSKPVSDPDLKTQLQKLSQN